MKLQHAFLIVLMLGLIARVFSFFLLPEATYSDALYHLILSRGIIENQTLSFTGFLTDAPLLHTLIATIFSISMLPIMMPFVRIIPVILFIAQMLLSFLILRKLFSNQFIVGLSLIAVFPWLIRYGTVNYLDTLASVAILFTIYLLMKFQETGKKIWLIAIIPAIFAIGTSSLTLLFVIPLMIIITAILMKKKNHSIKTILPMLAVLVLFSGIWFGLNLAKTGSVFSSVESSDPGISGTINNPNLFFPEFWIKSYLSFFDFPTIETFSRFSFLQTIPWEIISGIFAIITLPIFALIIFGAIKFLKEKNLIGKILILTILAVVAIAGYITLVDDRQIGLFYVRFLIAVMPLIGIMFAKGYLSLKKNSFKKIATISLLLFSIYSLMFTAGSAYVFNSIEQQHSGLYEFAKTLPEDSKIFSKIKSRAIIFNSGQNAGEIINYETDFYSLEADKIYIQLKENNFTHITEECYRNPWKPEKINQLLSKNFIKKVFENNCLKIYEIK